MVNSWFHKGILGIQTGPQATDLFIIPRISKIFLPPQKMTQQISPTRKTLPPQKNESEGKKHIPWKKIMNH